MSLWRLVAKEALRSAARKKVGAPYPFDGDKSPTESADKSAHSKACGCGASRFVFSRVHFVCLVCFVVESAIR